MQAIEKRLQALERAQGTGRVRVFFESWHESGVFFGEGIHGSREEIGATKHADDYLVFVHFSEKGQKDGE